MFSPDDFYMRLSASTARPSTSQRKFLIRRSAQDDNGMLYRVRKGMDAESIKLTADCQNGRRMEFRRPTRSREYERPGRRQSFYFAVGVVFFLPFPAAGACAFNVAFRARLRSRFFALDRLRVFSRAFSFGMVGLPDESVKF
jgi:hypothetical protein